MGMKNIHMCNFLTMNLNENLQEYLFVQNQSVIIKNEKKIMSENFQDGCWAAILDWLQKIPPAKI